MSLLEKDKAFVWHPFTQYQTSGDPIVITKGEKHYLYDEEGNKYIDANSSWWTNVHGHSNPYIAEKVYKQFLTLDHSIFAGATHPTAIEISERLIKLLGRDFQKVFFSDNGSTSTEVALKMAIQFWFNKGEQKRTRILALEGAYHGDTFGAMSVGQRGYFNKPFEHLFFDVDFIPFPTEENKEEVIAQVEKLFGTEEFAGFIFEPLVQGSAGMTMYAPEILDALLAIAKKYQVVTIADEVMTGFGRTGKLFAIDHLELSPDIICLSKGITGGSLPIGITVTSQQMFDTFLSDDTTKALLHGHSYTGNALCCAAVSASLDLFERESTWEVIRIIEKGNKDFVEKVQQHPKVRTARYLGTIMAFEVEQSGKSNYFSSIKEEAIAYFKSKGILLRPLGNVIFLNPPYTITQEDLDHVYKEMLAFLEKL
ncbi:MAG: adenosylmethionine--8-amino-7-oxononanoate transaminase [Crocinitomicaceae bacterium]|nr:adenosylmethionine--8-amino-7-oxononanoate transaminase [Crocinitomicaceae bacterium]